MVALSVEIPFDMTSHAADPGLFGGLFAPGGNTPGTDVAALADIARGTDVAGVVGSLRQPEPAVAAGRAVADAVPGARYVTLDGQDHGVLHQPQALLPLLTDFYLGHDN
jgi:hypothetical protein